MNRQQLKKTEGQFVRIQPPAKGPRGNDLDDDWIVLSVTDDAIRLAHSNSAAVASVGVDHVSSYFRDATRSTDGQQYGFLQLHSQIRIEGDGSVTVKPLPPPRLREAYGSQTVPEAGPPQSSTLAALSASGVSFTAPEWQQPAVRQLLDQTVPLRIKLEIIRNIGSGATPGLWIRGINEDAETVRGAAFKLLNVLRWDGKVDRFVETQDIHQNGPFQELETGKNPLFCSQAADLGFVRAEDNSLRIEGGREGGGRDQCRIITPGVWKLVGRIVAADGRGCDVIACFKWEGKGIPMPVTCPTYAIVSQAPPPHKPVGS